LELPDQRALEPVGLLPVDEHLEGAAVLENHEEEKQRNQQHLQVARARLHERQRDKGGANMVSAYAGKPSDRRRAY